VKMKTIGIIDYGSGNILSVRRAIEKLGNRTILISKNEDFKNISHAIIPGVGAFPAAISKLKARELDFGIKQHAKSGKKLLGICVGMQLLFDNSTENGFTDGLGLLKGNVVNIKSSSEFKIDAKVPNIGWRSLAILQYDSPYQKLSGEKFYHVHSYAPGQCVSDEILGVSHYANCELNVLCAKQNIIGAQFHPEKSGNAGLEFLDIFCH